MKNFAITGVGGYIAPRHLKAIQDTGNRLVAAADPHDAVGVLDRFAFEVRFFNEIERFDRHLEKLRRGPAEQRGEFHFISNQPRRDAMKREFQMEFPVRDLFPGGAPSGLALP